MDLLEKLHIKDDDSVVVQAEGAAVESQPDGASGPVFQNPFASKIIDKQEDNDDSANEIVFNPRPARPTEFDTAEVKPVVVEKVDETTPEFEAIEKKIMAEEAKEEKEVNDDQQPLQDETREEESFLMDHDDQAFITAEGSALEMEVDDQDDEVKIPLAATDDNVDKQPQKPEEEVRKTSGTPDFEALEKQLEAEAILEEASAKTSNVLIAPSSEAVLPSNNEAEELACLLEADNSKPDVAEEPLEITNEVNTMAAPEEPAASVKAEDNDYDEDLNVAPMEVEAPQHEAVLNVGGEQPLGGTPADVARIQTSLPIPPAKQETTCDLRDPPQVEQIRRHLFDSPASKPMAIVKPQEAENSVNKVGDSSSSANNDNHSNDSGSILSPEEDKQMFTPVQQQQSAGDDSNNTNVETATDEQIKTVEENLNESVLKQEEAAAVVNNMEAEAADEKIEIKETNIDDLVVPKKGYNLDFLDGLDDPLNANPFEVKTARVQLSPPPAAPLLDDTAKIEKIPIKQEEDTSTVKSEQQMVNSNEENNSNSATSDVKEQEEETIVKSEDKPKRSAKKPLPKKPWLRRKRPERPVTPKAEVEDQDAINDEDSVPAVPTKPGAYNLDFLDSIDDPNFNPFATKSKVSNEDQPLGGGDEAKPKSSGGYNLDFLDKMDDPNFDPFATKSKVMNNSITNVTETAPVVEKEASPALPALELVEKPVADEDTNKKGSTPEFEAVEKRIEEAAENCNTKETSPPEDNFEDARGGSISPDFSAFESEAKNIAQDLLLKQKNNSNDASIISKISPPESLSTTLTMSTTLPSIPASPSMAANVSSTNLKDDTLSGLNLKQIDLDLESPVVPLKSALKKTTTTASCDSGARQKVLSESVKETLRRNELFYEAQLLEKDKELHRKEKEIQTLDHEMHELKREVQSIGNDNTAMM